ncbi:Ham1-like protein [Metarhizium brunneum]
MYLPSLLTCIIAIFTHAHAAPRPDSLSVICPKSNTSSSPWPGTTPFTAMPLPTLPSAGDCAPGGVCDCSRIPDKNSNEYFQCVTNPNCEYCWVGRPTTSTSSSSKTLVANSTSISITDYHTMSPGTYTITTNGTVINIVVTQEIATPTSSTQVFVTMTETVVVTVSSASAWTAIKSSSTATVDDDCYGRCNCSKLEDKDSKGFFECLTNPDCEKCHSTNAAALATETTASSTISKSSASSTATTTSSFGAPTDACPFFCDCSGIEDKDSEE